MIVGEDLATRHWMKNEKNLIIFKIYCDFIADGSIGGDNVL